MIQYELLPYYNGGGSFYRWQSIIGFTESLRRVDAERPAVVQDIAVQPYQIYHEDDAFVLDYEHGFGLAGNLVEQVAKVHGGEIFERAGRKMVLFDSVRNMQGFIDNIRTLNVTYTNDLRDALIERLRAAGISVNTDWQEGERVLAQENGHTREMSSSQKRAMETASVSHDEEHQHAVISFADGAKVRNNLETLANFLEKVSNQRKNLCQKFLFCPKKGGITISEQSRNAVYGLYMRSFFTSASVKCPFRQISLQLCEGLKILFPFHFHLFWGVSVLGAVVKMLIYDFLFFRKMKHEDTLYLCDVVVPVWLLGLLR